MPQIGFNAEAIGVSSCLSAGGDMGRLMRTEARPSLVTLECGMQALVQVTGFTYVEGLPLALCGLPEEDVESSDWLVSRANGVDKERIVVAADSGRGDRF